MRILKKFHRKHTVTFTFLHHASLTLLSSVYLFMPLSSYNVVTSSHVTDQKEQVIYAEEFDTPKIQQETAHVEQPQENVLSAITEVFISPTPTATHTPTPTPTFTPSPTPTNTLTPTPTATFTPTTTPTPLPPPPSPEEIDKHFTEFSAEYDVDITLLKHIAHCESRYNPGAVNGPYAGMFQYVDTTWIATRNDMGLDPNPDLRFDAKEAIRTSAFKISRGGQNAWRNCLP